MRRLRLGESRLGERQSRGVHLPLVQWDPSLARGPRELRAKRDDGLVERRSVELDARGGERRDERVHGAVRDGRADADAGKVRERRRAGVARASEVRGERWGVETAEVVEVVGWESRGGARGKSASGSSMELFQFEARPGDEESSGRDKASAKANVSKTGYDLSTGQGSLVSKRYEPDDDGWVPPPPPLPKGAKPGEFLSGMTPYQWVDFLKRSLQDDRTYHLKNMTDEERAQVVAAMSGLPIPPRSGKKHVPKDSSNVAVNSAASDLKTLNPFEDASSSTGGTDEFFNESVEKSKKEKKEKKEKKDKKEKKEKKMNENETDLERRMREAGEAAKALARERMLSNPDASASVYAVPEKKKPSYSPQQSYFHGSSNLGRSGSSKYEGFGNTSSLPPPPQDWQSKMKSATESAKGWLSGTLKGLAAKLDNTSLAHGGASGSSRVGGASYQQMSHQTSRPPEVQSYRPPEVKPYDLPPRPVGKAKPESFYSSESGSDSDSD